MINRSYITLDIYQDEITLERTKWCLKQQIKIDVWVIGTIIWVYNSKLSNTTRLGMIFQNPVFLNTSVYSNLDHALFCINIDKNKRKLIITNLLNKSLGYLSNKHIRLLSGGELQLVSLLRSLVIQPKIIFYDEPTNNLDQYNMDLIKDIIKSMISEKNK